MYAKQIGGDCHLTTPILLDKSDPPIAIYTAGSQINIVSLLSGDVISTYMKHEQQVVKLIHQSDDPDIVISCSIDGHISYWNIHTLEETKKYNLNIKLFDLFVPTTVSNQLILVTEYTDELMSQVGDIGHAKDESNNHKPIPTDKHFLVLYDLLKKQISRPLVSMRYSKNCFGMFISKGEEYVVAVNSKLIYFFNLNNKHRLQFKNQLGPMNQLAISQSKDTVATAHRNGEICLWYDIGDWLSSVSLNLSAKYTIVKGRQKPLHTVLHWHAHQLKCLCFNPDGTFLYSGGEEAVLVQWQLSSNNNKVFLPRVGGLIASVASAAEDALVIMTINNNSLLVVDTARMSVEWTIQSLCITPSIVSNPEDTLYHSDPNYKCKIAIDPTSGFLACSGYPGHIQLYDPYSNTFKKQIEVVKYTHISRTELYSRIYIPSVSLFHFTKLSINGAEQSYLATLDVRRGEEIGVEDSLKVWHHSVESDEYVQIAQIDRPHGNCRVVSLRMQQTQLGCMTSATDGMLKLWTTTAASENNVKAEPQWICLYAFKYRECAANFTCFSSDDSVLAVAYENVVSLWDSQAMSLKTSVVSSTANHILFVAFAQPINGHAYLVMGSKRCLSVVDLLTLKTVWAKEGRFSSFAVAATESNCLMKDKTCPLGWIACGISPTLVPSQGEERTDPEVDDDTVTEHSLAVFTLLSADPLVTVPTSCKVNSIVFNSPPEEEQPLNEGASVIYLLASGSMFSIGGTTTSYTAAAQGKLSITSLPALSKGLLQSTSAEAITYQPAPSLSNNSFLSKYIDADSSNIAPVTDIYSAFMEQFIPKVNTQSSVAAEEENDVDTRDISTARRIEGRSSGDFMTNEKFEALRLATASIFSRSNIIVPDADRSALKEVTEDSVEAPVKKRKSVAAGAVETAKTPSKRSSKVVK